MADPGIDLFFFGLSEQLLVRIAKVPPLNFNPLPFGSGGNQNALS